MPMIECDKCGKFGVEVIGDEALMCEYCAEDEEYRKGLAEEDAYYTMKEEEGE